VPDGRGGMAHKLKDGKIDTEKTDFFSTGMGAALIFDFTDNSEKLRELKEELAELEGPGGNKVFHSFEFKQDEEYRGRGPALTGRLNREFVIGDTDKGYFGEPPNAYHSYTGIFGAIGENIREGSRRDAEIIDIAPTVLHLMDLEIPGYMEGEVLKDIEVNPSEPEKRIVDDLDI
jgi:predicted AlkP superfamily phosphohydrolase/phosphomutase